MKQETENKNQMSRRKPRVLAIEKVGETAQVLLTARPRYESYWAGDEWIPLPRMRMMKGA